MPKCCPVVFFTAASMWLDEAHRTTEERHTKATRSRPQWIICGWKWPLLGSHSAAIQWRAVRFFQGASLARGFGQLVDSVARRNGRPRSKPGGPCADPEELVRLWWKSASLGGSRRSGPAACLHVARSRGTQGAVGPTDVGRLIFIAPCRTWRGATLSLFAVVGTPPRGPVLVSCEFFFPFLKLPHQSFFPLFIYLIKGEKSLHLLFSFHYNFGWMLTVANFLMLLEPTCYYLRYF
jgi:hypothetical protein